MDSETIEEDYCPFCGSDGYDEESGYCCNCGFLEEDEEEILLSEY